MAPEGPTCSHGYKPVETPVGGGWVDLIISTCPVCPKGKVLSHYKPGEPPRRPEFYDRDQEEPCEGKPGSLVL